MGIHVVCANAIENHDNANAGIEESILLVQVKRSQVHGFESELFI